MFCEPTSVDNDSRGEFILIPDEGMLIRAIDQKQITSWAQFEYVLTVIVENRLLRLYQAHLDQQYRIKADEELKALLEETDATAQNALTSKNKRKRKKKNKKRSSGTNKQLAELT